MNNNYRWGVVVGALVLAAIVGMFAYNFGVAQGVEESGKVVAGGPWPYHHGWGFPFFFAPFFFVIFGLALLRGLFWRGRGCAYSGGNRFDEWHRRAHERMGNGGEQQADPGRR